MTSGRLNTLLWLNRRLFWNGLRSSARRADTAASLVLACVAVLFSVVLAGALGLILSLGLRSDDADAQRIALLILFWIIAFFAVIMPVIIGISQRSVPLQRLLVFPFAIRDLYRVTLLASAAGATHLFWYPAMLSASVVAVGSGRVPVLPWLLVAALFTMCLVTWCHAVLLLMQRLLRRRSVKELVALVGLAVVVLASMVPALLDSRGVGHTGKVPIPESMISAVFTAASLLPPSIAADAILAVSRGGAAGVVPALALLVLWTGTGLIVGYGLFRRFLIGGEGGESAAKARNETAPRHYRTSVSGVLDRLPAPLHALASRELRYLLRSVPGKLSIILMPVLVVVMGFVVASDMTGRFLGLDRSSLAFLGIMVYCATFSNNFVYNAYAWEGSGIRSYFMNPVVPRQIVLGKNIGLWLFNLLLAFECMATFIVMFGPLHPAAFVSGCLAFASALLVATAAGNFVSPVLPVPRDISKVSNSPSQTGILVSLGMLVADVAIIGGLAAIAAFSDSPWLLPMMLAVLVVVLGAGYHLLLTPAARLLEQRREALLDALQTAR